MAEMPSDEFLTDQSNSLLQLSLPENDQTWLYCLHESDQNIIVDLSYFLCWDSVCKDRCELGTVEDNTRNEEDSKNGDQINTTFLLSKAQRTSENRRTKLKHPNKKNTSFAQDSPTIEENFTLLSNARLPIQSEQMNLKCNNKDESLKFNAKQSINSNQDTTLKNSSDSWNISEHTLLANISAPTGFMDSTSISRHRSSTDFPIFSKLNFNPNSVSTPTKKFMVCADTDEISNTPENMNEPLINNNTLEDNANNTYSVSLSNTESSDKHISTNFNATTTFSNSKNDVNKTADVIEELDAKDKLENTYIFEDSTSEKLSPNNSKIITNDNENLISNEDSMNSKIDEALKFPYNSETDFNSTITIKSKDNDDSEDDSCYSSSSNIRSLGDVCDMISQLQPQKSSNVDCTLTKTRSEDSLCLPEHACSSRKPKKHYGSALNLETHNNNQLAADRRLHQNPNYFLRKPGSEVAPPIVSLPENNDKYVSKENTTMPTRISRIPRLQSKIPKLISKK